MDISAPTEGLVRPLLEEGEDEVEGQGNLLNEAETTMTTTEEVTFAPWYRDTRQMTAMLSNYSTSYNVVNISLVLPILEILHSANDEALASCASSLLAGMIVGQLVGGALGDSFLGRLGALRLVMLLQIIASLGSVFLNVNGEHFYNLLATWRFLLGVGAGGVYPLAAVLSREQGKVESNSHDEDEDKNNQAYRVVLTFSTQGLGFVTVPIVAIFLFQLTDDLNVIWKLLLGLGCVPGFILMILQCRLYAQERNQNESISQTENEIEDNEISSGNDSEEPEEFDDDGVSSESRLQGDGWFKSLLYEPGLVKKVLGTAGTWFFFDIIFYGNTIFQPIVVEAAFGAGEAETPIQELSEMSRRSLILTSIALPGYFVAAAMIGKRTLCLTQTPRYVMMQGFAAMAILYSYIGINWSHLQNYPALLIFLYGMTFFFANYGPNTTTFILPSLMYSPDNRSTWNGISAACGKLGALAGASLFAPAADELGDNIVMLLCAGMSVIALILTCFFVPKVQYEHQS
jgi:PHS family inorganic phosphate transporter-like MFS transporter